MKISRLTTGLISGLLLIIILIIMTFQIIGNSSPEIKNAADNISGSGLPLASLFAASGAVLLVFMAGVLTVIILVVIEGDLWKK